MGFLGDFFKRLEGTRSACIICDRRTDNVKISGDGVCICKACFEKLMRSKVPDYYDVKGEIGRLFAPFDYDGRLKELVLEMKFFSASAYSVPLAGLLYEALPPYYDFSGFDMILPVPLHPKRLDERGFNQAELIAEALSVHMGIPMYSDLLFRIRDTKRQMTLSRTLRVRNVKGAFWAHESVENKNILLVDDIYTVGATIAECALALKAKGAARVDAVVLCTNFKDTGYERPPTVPVVKMQKT